MPLSDEENRILSQIERQFYEHDPALAEQMATTTIYTDSMRRIKISIAGFLVGLVFSFLSAWLCVRWLLRYISTHSFVPFAWYRIVFGIVVLGTSLSGLVVWAD